MHSGKCSTTTYQQTIIETSIECTEMNYPSSSDAAAAAGGGTWWCYPDDADEAATLAVPTSGDTTASSFADMIADYSTDDLFELVWEQEAGEVGASGSSSSVQRAVSCLWSPRFSKPPPEVRFDPPSEDEMAACLCAIFKGEAEELAGNVNDGDNRSSAVREHMADGRDVVVSAAKGSTAATTTTDTKDNIPISEVMGNKEIRKAPTEGSSRRSHSHHGEAHNLTAKKRRHKINERLKTLQQLIPGCSKLCNQASTLDQTIHYMKSLQQQVQAMSVGLAPAAAMYPVVQPQCVPPAGTPVAVPIPAAPMMVLGHPPSATMVPFGAMLQFPHYPAAVTMVPAAAPRVPLYPAPAPAKAAGVAAGDAMSVSFSHRHGSSSRSSGKGKGSSRSSLGETEPDHHYQGWTWPGVSQ